MNNTDARIRAGDLDELVSVQLNTPTRGSNGEELDSWATIEAPHAAVEPVHGRELFGSDLKMAELPTTFRFRYSAANAGLTTEHRIVWRSNNWDLQSVRVVGRQKLWECVGVIRNG